MISASASPAALSRLRVLLGDQLFLRSADGLLPMPRAPELAEPISQALHQIEAALVRKSELKRPSRSIWECLITRLLWCCPQSWKVGMQAPGVTINVHAFNDRDDAIALLDAGVIDVAIGVPPTYAEGRILTRPILSDEFTTVIANDHPAARRSMNIKTYLSLSHVLASPEGRRHGLVGQALAQMNKQRTLALLCRRCLQYR